MCSLFWQRMENDQGWQKMESDQGDLADIFGASGSSGIRSMSNSSINWQIQSEPTNYPSGIEDFDDSFGDPFLSMRVPLLHHEFNMGGPEFFGGSDSTGLAKEDDSVPGQVLGEEIKEPCNIFSRMLQISPNPKMSLLPHNSNIPSPAVASPRGLKPSSLDANDMIKSSSANCLVGLQIPPPRNPGIKRRKSQTRKVVCIPAPPAAANSTKPSGEVVPSDHWAWRKYGQKPIKGSPYPRGYYRCSSSKGCLARKQVERSRNDPNMLVITYTSEHNHPWPTQRNALAGSTRTQPIKKDAASKSSPSTQSPKPASSKEEPKEIDKDGRLAVTFGGSSWIASGSSLKEEMGKIESPMIDMAYREFDQDFNHQNYAFVQQDSNQADDFFDDLGELEPDSLDAMFSQGFTAGKSEEDGRDKSMDPFSSLFDSSGGSIGEAGKGL